MTSGGWCGIDTPRDTMPVSTDLQSSFALTCRTRVDARHAARGICYERTPLADCAQPHAHRTDGRKAPVGLRIWRGVWKRDNLPDRADLGRCIRSDGAHRDSPGAARTNYRSDRWGPSAPGSSVATCSATACLASSRGSRSNRGSRQEHEEFRLFRPGPSGKWGISLIVLATLMTIMDKTPLASLSGAPGRESRSRARVEFVAFPVAILAAFLFRAESFSTSMGPDELSLLVMAKSIIDGAFPYEVYWDVRAPLAYFIALPSALLDDAFAALATLRLLTVFVQAGATWTFFCLFRRALGAPAALVGALVLLVSTNMADLHHLAMPNHFVMGMSLAAFACLVAGIRGSRLGLFFSALLAGVLPWVMVQSGLVTLGLAALVMFADPSLRRTERLMWASIAVLPSVVVIGAFFFWGPFDTFVRTVFLAPFGVIEAGLGMDWSWRWQTPSGLLGSVPWRVVYILTLIVGAVLFRSAARHAPSGFADWVTLPSLWCRS